MKQYAKALIGAVIAFLSGVTAILSQGHGINLNGWLTATLAGFVALNTVWLVPNASADPNLPAPTHSAL